MSLIDIKAVTTAARKEIADEQAAKAKTALVKKLRELSVAEDVVKNIKRSIEDLEKSITDGSFVS